MLGVTLGGAGWKSGLLRARGTFLFMWGSGTTPEVTTPQFLLSGPLTEATSITEPLSHVISTTISTINAIRAAIGNPLNTDNLTFTLRINGVDTTLTATILANNSTGADVGNTATTNAGDLLSMKIVQSGTESRGSPSNIRVSIRAIASESALWTWGGSNLTNAAQRYLRTSQHNIGPNLLEAASDVLIAHSRTAESMYVYHDVASPVTAVNYVFRVNSVSTALSCVMPIGGNTINNTSQLVSLNTGDIVTMGSKQTTTDSTACVQRVTVGQTSGGRVLCWDGAEVSGTPNLKYLNAGSSGSPVTTYLAQSQFIAVVGGNIGILNTFLATVGVTDSFTSTFQVNGVDTSVSCVMNPGNPTGQDISHTATYADGDFLSLKFLQSGSETGPAGPRATVSIAE